MILVDVYVPVMDEIYDFYLDEDVEIGLLIPQIAESICQKEQSVLKGNPDALTLWKPDIRSRLMRDTTLRKAGVGSGTGCSWYRLREKGRSSDKTCRLSKKSKKKMKE